jgi:hypothetical protein
VCQQAGFTGTLALRMIGTRLPAVREPDAGVGGPGAIPVRHFFCEPRNLPGAAPERRSPRRGFVAELHRRSSRAPSTKTDRVRARGEHGRANLYTMPMEGSLRGRGRGTVAPRTAVRRGCHTCSVNCRANVTVPGGVRVRPPGAVSGMDDAKRELLPSSSKDRSIRRRPLADHGIPVVALPDGRLSI